jgi:hypothetical protein
VYRLRDAEVDEHYTLAEVATRIPSGVICLLSALRYHEIGTQSPAEVWVAIGEKSHRPTITTPRLRVVRFSGPAMHEGVEHHLLNGVSVPITSMPKTVADCFKYRSKIGLDVALEALRDCLENRRCTREELHASAKVCRVSNVMRPYMEALTWARKSLPDWRHRSVNDSSIFPVNVARISSSSSADLVSSVWLSRPGHPADLCRTPTVSSSIITMGLRREMPESYDGRAGVNN